ncbi:DUF192 domain-containing protein [Candidatus Parvarchaeota archaeon]|nr:DUF192 domain-containing protein [Candidatus Parvarchaeota archaeon]
MKVRNDGKGVIVLCILSLVALAFVPGCTVADGDGKNRESGEKTSYRHATVRINNSFGDVLAVDSEIADNDSTRARGLMFRERLEDGKGMLFVFGQQGNWGFYMKNMKIPLDIIYISSGSVQDKGKGPRVSKIRESFQPCRPKTACEVDYSGDAVLYALEVPAGWSKKNKIETGNLVYIDLA